MLTSDNVQEHKDAKNTDTENGIKLKLKIKKLKMAAKIAFTKSKRNKILESANEIETQLDTKIRSVALNKFAIAKNKRLKGLGKSHSEVRELISTLDVSSEGVADRGKTALKGFGIDSKFVGMSTVEILSKVGQAQQSIDSEELISDIPQSEPDSLETPRKDITNDIVSGIADALSEDSPGDSDEIVSPNKVVPTTEPLEVKSNSDTDTEEDINKNNEKIYEYLIKSGEVDIAEHILGIMTDPKSGDIMKTSDINANTEEVKRLSDINSGIYDKLDELEKGLIDEQDTTVSIQEKLNQTAQSEVQSAQNPEEKKSIGFLESMLSMIFGGGVMDILTGGSAAKMIKRIMGDGWKYLKKRIKSLVKAGLKSLKQNMLKAISNVKAFAVEKIKLLGDKISEIWQKVRKFLNLPDKDKKLKSDKKQPKKTSTGTELDAKDPKNADIKQEAKKAKPKLKGRAARAQKLSQARAKLPVPKGGKGILRKLLRFTKPIPFIGTAIAAGTAIYSAYDGYTNAAEILGKDKKDLTIMDKLASSAGALVNDVSFGVLSSKSVAETLLEWSGETQDAVIEKYKKLGVIDHDVIGNSEINNWNVIKTMPSKDLAKIIDFDDFSDEDTKKLEEIYEESRLREGLPGKGESMFNEQTTQRLKDESEKKVVQEKIKQLEAKIEKGGSTRTQSRIKQQLVKQQKDLEKLNISINKNTVEAPQATKDKRMMEINDSYNSTINNTKQMYVNRNGGNQSNTVINTTNGNRQAQPEIDAIGAFNH